MIVRYVLTRDILRRSTNPGVSADAKVGFVCGADRSSAGVTAWRNDGVRDLKFLGLFLGKQLEGLDDNAIVNFLIEMLKPEIFKSLRKRTLSILQERGGLSEYVDLQSGLPIPADQIKFILEYSQGLLGYLQEAFTHTGIPQTTGDKFFKQSHRDVVVENNGDGVVVRTHVANVVVSRMLDNGGHKTLGNVDTDVTSVFREITAEDFNKGKYQLEIIQADTDLAVYLLMNKGQMSDLNWAGRNLALARPAVLTLGERLQQGFRYAFTGDASNTNAWKAFFGIPGSTAYNNTLLDKIWGYSGIGNILSGLKNLVKLGTEYLSFAVKEISRSAFDACRAGWKKSDAISNPLGWFFAKAATGIGMFLSGACYYASKFTHEVVKRVTSPERAAREADKKHKALGWASRLFSFAAYIGIALFVPPVGIPVVGKLFGATVATSVTAAVTQTAVSGLPVAAAIVGGSFVKTQVALNAQVEQQQRKAQAVQEVFNNVCACDKRIKTLSAQSNAATPALASTAGATAAMRARPGIVVIDTASEVDEGLYTPSEVSWSPALHATSSPKSIPQSANSSSSPGVTPGSVSSDHSVRDVDTLRPPTPDSATPKSLRRLGSPSIGKQSK